MPEVSPETYACWRATALGQLTEQLELDLVLELAGPLASKRVLDVGTGDGTYALAAAARGAHVTGLDPSQAMLAAAAERAKREDVALELRSGVAEQLPFADDSFDVVLAVTVLCFVSDPDLAVHEMSRVLAPGGRLVLADLGRWSTWAAWRRVKQIVGVSTTWKDVHFWSRRRLVGLVEGAGLRVESVRGAVYYPPMVPPVKWAASWLAGLDPSVGRIAPSLGALIALACRKPAGP